MPPLPQEPAPGSPRRAAGAAAVARAAKAACEAAAAGVQAANVVAHIYNKEAERAQSEVGVLVPPVLPPPLPEITTPPPPPHTHTHPAYSNAHSDSFRFMHLPFSKLLSASFFGRATGDFKGTKA